MDRKVELYLYNNGVFKKIDEIKERYLTPYLQAKYFVVYPPKKERR